MPLLKTRPKILVRVPSEVRPGDRPVLLVLLDCRREVEVEHVELDIVGRERWSHPASRSTTVSSTFLQLGARLCGKRKLDRGRSELPVQIPIPPDAPPSFRGTLASIDYELCVRASVPWWPDARAAFELKLVPREEPDPAPSPQVYSTDPAGPRGTEPHFELSLGSSWTRAGDVVEGAIALHNVAFADYSKAKICLRSAQRLHGTNGTFVTEHEGVRYQIALDVSRVTEGEMVPFRFRLPDDLEPEVALTVRPGHRQPLLEVRWGLEVEAGGCTVRVPYRVLPRARGPGRAPMRLAPPTIGGDRLRALWEATGQAHGLGYEAQALHGVFGETQLSVRRDHRGRDGVFLTAELRYPDLGLDLRVEPAGLARRLLGTGVPIHDERLASTHLAEARDEAQVQSMLRIVATHTRHALLRGMDDEGVVVAWRDSGQSASRLSQFLAASVRLAQSIERQRAQIPPPASMLGVLDAWRALATDLGGPLETGPMRIRGGAAGVPASVVIEHDGSEPVATWLAIQPSTPLDEAHRWTWRSEGGPEAIDARFKGEPRELVRAIVQSASELRIEPARIALRIAAPLGLAREGVHFPTEQAKLRIERMARLSALLRAQVGPYR